MGIAQIVSRRASEASRRSPEVGRRSPEVSRRRHARQRAGETERSTFGSTSDTLANAHGNGCNTARTFASTLDTLAAVATYLSVINVQANSKTVSFFGGLVCLQPPRGRGARLQQRPSKWALPRSGRVHEQTAVKL